MKNRFKTPVPAVIRGLLVAALMIASPAGATIIPVDLHKELAQRALGELWSALASSAPEQAARISDGEKRRLPIDRANIAQVIRVGEISGAAKWCGVPAESNRILLQRSGKRYGLGEKALFYMTILHAVASASARSMLEKDPCEAKTRSAVTKWMKRHSTEALNLRHSAPDAMTRNKAILATAVTGVWVGPDARFRNGRIVSGQGLYVGVDGIGVSVLGAYPVQRRALLDGKQKELALHVRETENSVVVFSRTFDFDPQNRTLTDRKTGLVLRRVQSEFSDELRVSLGVEPSSNAVRQYFDSEDGLRAFYRIYWHYDDHKAFAVSPMGAWGYSGRRKLSRAAAIEEALRYCNSNVNAGDPPCFVLSVNGSLEPRPAARQQRKRAAIGPALAGLPMNTQMK